MSKLTWLTGIIKKYKKLLIIGVVISGVAIAGVAVVKNMNQKKEQMQAMMNQTQTSKVERRTLVSSVSATGTLTSVESKDVSVSLSGVEVKSVSVEIGDVVETGQVLCVLDSQDIQEELADAKVALNVANEKTKMDLTAAERSLQDVLEDYNIDLDRGNQELLSYYNDYEEALKDLEEAKKEWDEAIQTTKDYKAEYDYQNGLLENAEEKMDSMSASSTYSQEFNITKNMLIEYAKKNNVTMNNAIESRLVIGRDLSDITIGTKGDEDFVIGTGTTQPEDSPSDDQNNNPSNDSGNTQGNNGTEGVATSGVSDGTSTVSEGDIKKTTTEPETTTEPTNNQKSQTEDEIQLITTMTEVQENENKEQSQEYDGNTDVEAVKKKINGYLSTLRSLSSMYNSSNNLDEDYNTLKQEVSNWQSKYNTAQQEESSAEKTYEQAVSALESAIEAYEKQLRNLDDTKKSGENSILSKSESLYNTQLNSITSGDSEEEKIEDYLKQLDDCTVKAPISGVVSAVNIEVGDMYNGSAIVTIDDTSSFEVTTEIDEYDIGKIEKGQKVIIKTNATGEEELEGTVKRISPRASSGGNEVTYTVLISVDTPHEMLRMDMTAKLSIILESKENVLTVPYEAVQEDQSGKYYVEVAVETNENNETDAKEVSQKPEGMDKDNMPQMPEGMNFGDMPQKSEGMSGGKSGNRQKMSASGNMETTEISTKRIYVEKGIESDYYIEIISNEISEGMKIVVPSSDKQGGGRDIQNMMMRQGPMGGF